MRRARPSEGLPEADIERRRLSPLRAVERGRHVEADRADAGVVAQAESGREADPLVEIGKLDSKAVPASTKGTMPMVSVILMRASIEPSSRLRPPIGSPKGPSGRRLWYS